MGLSIEEKAKRYDEALGKARRYYDEYKTRDNILYVEDMEEMFPELKESEDEAESEDEKVRKVLIELISTFLRGHENGKIHGVYAKDILTWLEKQGEQKCTCQLNNLKSNIKFPFKAKVKSSGVIVTICNGQLSLDGKEWIKYQSGRKDGYKVYEPDNLELVREIEQKSAWSEEDEDILNTIINHFKVDIECTDEDDIVRWLKFLKYRYTWKPSDEQLKSLQEVIDAGHYTSYPYALETLYEQLKKLRDE